MAIFIATRIKLNPTDLFKEVYDNGFPIQKGMKHDGISFLGKKHGVLVTWTDDTDSVYNALRDGKGVIYNVGPENKYKFTKEGHYIFLKGAKIQNGIKKVYVFDPNSTHNYINVLFPLKESDGGIEVAKRGRGAEERGSEKST